MKRLTKVVGTLVAAGAATMMAIGPASADIAPVKPYAVGLSAGYATERLLSVGDRVPETGNPGAEYQMVGIPDGLGAERHGNDVTVFMNHELTQPTTSEPEVGRPANRGALVSKYALDKHGQVASGERAYDTTRTGGTSHDPGFRSARSQKAP